MVDAYSGGALGAVGIAFAFGGVVAAMIFALGHISGAHINPAVTLAFWTVRRFPGKEVIPYVVAQCAGAVSASFVLRALLGSMGHMGATLPNIGIARSFGVEFLFSFLLMLVIMAVATDERAQRSLAPLAVGLTVGICAALGAMTGSSMNPARSLGPAMAGGGWTGHWLYWAAPICGMLVAAYGYELLREKGAGT
jgi:MIP family channel proteins